MLLLAIGSSHSFATESRNASAFPTGANEPQAGVLMIISGPPHRVATTGRPHAIASRMTSPSPSSSDDSKNMLAFW